MKILIVHNHYMERGGEDSVVESEIRMLKSFGHEVTVYLVSNAEIFGYSLSRKLWFFLWGSVWSVRTYDAICALLQREKPDVVHVHNTFFMITPSIYDACTESHIPVVQTLHNYRLNCANALFYRKGKVCEECLQSSILLAPFKRCWRGSFFMTFMAAKISFFHRMKKTYTRSVALFIAASCFSREKLVAGGLPAEKVMVKPNFLETDLTPRKDHVGDYVLYVGALREYKGPDIFAAAAARLPDIRFRCIGDGPMRDMIRNMGIENLNCMGDRSLDEVLEFMGDSAFFVVSSRCYETFSRVVMEAYGRGVPVVAPKIGAFVEIVHHGKSGMLFEPGDSWGLARVIDELMHDKDRIIQMGKYARALFEDKYQAERNHEILLALYRKAIATAVPQSAEKRAL